MASYTIMVKFAQKNIMVERVKRYYLKLYIAVACRLFDNWYFCFLVFCMFSHKVFHAKWTGKETHRGKIKEMIEYYNWHCLASASLCRMYNSKRYRVNTIDMTAQLNYTHCRPAIQPWTNKTVNNTNNTDRQQTLIDLRHWFVPNVNMFIFQIWYDIMRHFQMFL